MAGDELSLVNDYFGDGGEPSGDGYEDDYDDGVEPSSATPEQQLVDEYRESSFDAGEVQEWRQAGAGILAGEYTADDYLAAYDDDGEDDYSGQHEADADALIDLGNGQVATPEEWAASMQRQGITPEMLVEAWVQEHPDERLMQNWLHLDNLNQVLAERQDRQADEQNQQLAQAESEARGLVADAFRAAGAGRVDVDTGLRAAITVAETQISNWQQAGYSAEQIDEMTTTGEFDRWCIETAAELGRQASITHYALGKV